MMMVADSVSELKSLIQFSDQILHSFSTLLPPIETLIECPFNPHHLIPPPSLFLHSLRCSSSPHPHSTSSYFFYQDCPSAVRFSIPPNTTTSFTLPPFFSHHFPNHPSILPSELWAIRAETDAWTTHYPAAYSHPVLRAISGAAGFKNTQLMDWLITNSPRYGGVVIDVAMRDHIFLLFRLCLEAVIKEAVHYQEMNDSSTSFECPVLVQALMWLASQLSILYGEMNGKLFAIHMLKQCVLEAATLGLLFTIDTEEGSRVLETDGTVAGEAICVSQVEAAVFALRERALLEENIKGLRVSQPLNRVAEHDYLSQRACEERKRRPNYRPILEYDGLRQQSFKQETNKDKTEEELLAEERDYKRRRMSYRGKKGKKTVLQVRRDIIDKYMEEIKQAGGIGCFVKGTEDRGMFPSESPSAHDSSTITVDEPRESDYAATRGSQYNDRTQSHSDYSKSSKSWKDASSLKDYEQPSGSLNEHHEYVDLRSFSRDTRDRENYSRSSGRYDSHGRSHVRSCHQREREDLEVTNTRHHEIKQPSSVMLKYHYSRSSSSASNSVNDSSAKKDEQNLKVENRRRRNTYENHRNAFDDRYIPSESHDMYEDDLSPLAACIGPDKLCVRELLDQPCSHSSIRHIPDYHDKSE